LPVRPPKCEIKSPVPFKNKKTVADQLQSRPNGPPLFFEKIPQARQLNDVVRRQNRADKISLRHRVNFIQMTPRFWLQHKFPDALVESAFDDHVAARAE
jgi:hypothetical protein